MNCAVAIVWKILLMQTFSVLVQQTSGLFFTAPINYKYPCSNTSDVVMACEPDVFPEKIKRFFVKINRNFTSNYTVRLSFDSDIIISFLDRKYNYTEWSSILHKRLLQGSSGWTTRVLRAGDIMEKRFLNPQTGFSFVFKGTTSEHPNLTSLTINDMELCKEPIKGLFNKCGHAADYSPVDKTKNKSVRRKYAELDFQCGRRIRYRGWVTDPDTGIDLPLDNGSAEDGIARAGDWPWHVAVIALPMITYMNLDEGFIEEQYKCGGTLISRNFVLTAKHCAWLFNKNIEQESTEFNVFYVALGRTDFLLSFREKNNLKVVRIITPPSNTNSSWLDDIALLKLQSEVRFTREIQPACLWHRRENDLKNDNRVGVLAGWGRTNDERLPRPLQQVKLPMVSRDICIKNVPIFEPYVTEKDFCAGYLNNGTAPCFGDIGGTLQIFIPDYRGDKSPIISGAWYVRGIMTKAMSNTMEAVECDENTYAVFAKEEDFADWIDSNLGS